MHSRLKRGVLTIHCPNLLAINWSETSRNQCAACCGQRELSRSHVLRTVAVIACGRLMKMTRPAHLHPLEQIQHSLQQARLRKAYILFFLDSFLHVLQYKLRWQKNYKSTFAETYPVQ